jgi:HSP20 family protein
MLVMSSIAIRRPTNDAAAPADASWDPRRTVQALRSRDPFGEAVSAAGRLAIFVYAFDIEETNDAYELKVDVPGLRENDLDVTISGNRLTVSGRRPDSQGQFVHCNEGGRCNESGRPDEREHGTFTRGLTLPDCADTANVCATLENGVLVITVPKRPEARGRKAAATG